MTVTRIETRPDNFSDYLHVWFFDETDVMFKIRLDVIEDIEHPLEHSTMVEFYLGSRGMMTLPFAFATDAAAFVTIWRGKERKSFAPIGEILYTQRKESSDA